jgi:hypothetical protein
MPRIRDIAPKDDDANRHKCCAENKHHFSPRCGMSWGRAPVREILSFLWDINRNLKRLIEIVEEIHLGMP